MRGAETGVGGPAIPLLRCCGSRAQHGTSNATCQPGALPDQLPQFGLESRSTPTTRPPSHPHRHGPRLRPVPIPITPTPHPRAPTGTRTRTRTRPYLWTHTHAWPADRASALECRSPSTCPESRSAWGLHRTTARPQAPGIARGRSPTSGREHGPVHPPRHRSSPLAIGTANMGAGHEEAGSRPDCPLRVVVS